MLTQHGVSVDQLSGQNPTSHRQSVPQGGSHQQISQHPVSQQQQTTNFGAVANSIRMHLAPDRMSNLASTQSSHQPVVTTVPGQTSQSQAFATPPVHLTQQKLPRQPVLQQVNSHHIVLKQIGQQVPKFVPQNQIPTVTQNNPRFLYTGGAYQQLVTGNKPTLTTSNPRQTVVPQSSQQPSGMQGQPTNMQPSQMPAQSFLQQNVGVNQQYVLPRRPASPVEASNHIRPGETSNRRDQQAANQVQSNY